MPAPDPPIPSEVRATPLRAVRPPAPDASGATDAGAPPGVPGEAGAPARPSRAHDLWGCRRARPHYERRHPEESVLYRVVAAHLETFKAECERAGEPLPKRIVQAFERFMSCGVLSEGFCRVRCSGCGADTLVAFSCKQRGVCPSCAARRAAESAAWLVDRVLPQEPIRQWTISPPFRLRLLLAHDGELRRRVLDECQRTVFDGLRERCADESAQCGCVVFYQPFGSKLNIHPHFHALVPDGVYVSQPGREGSAPSTSLGTGFVEAPPLRDEDVVRVAQRIAQRVQALLDRRLAHRRVDDEPPGAQQQLQAASLDNLASLGPRAGKKTRRVGGEPQQRQEPPLCALADGWSVHAARRIERERRMELEGECRYGLRGPLALWQLEELPGGRIGFHLKHPASDGTEMLVLEPLELLEKLTALLPKPGEHHVHFFGVLAAHAARRAQVIPPCGDQEPGTAQLGGRTRRRLSWAQLLRRVFALELMVCPLCGGQRRVIAAIEKGAVAKAILECLGLPTEPPPRAAARGPPQGEFDCASAPDDFDQRVPAVA